MTRVKELQAQYYLVVVGVHGGGGGGIIGVDHHCFGAAWT